jgi:hypothetical protein
MLATRLRMLFTPLLSTLPGLGRSAAVTASRSESSSSVPWLNMRDGVANCALPEILRPPARMSLRPPSSAGTPSACSASTTGRVNWS